MKPYHNKNPFEYMSQQQFSTDYLVEVKKMVEQYNEILGDGFWSDFQNFNGRKKKSEPMVPIEMWENEQHLFLLIIMPGIVDEKQIKITYYSPQHITVKAKVKSIQPIESQSLLFTELPRYTMKREIKLPLPVNTDQHTISIENGVVTCTIPKADNYESNVDIPLDF